MNITRKTTNKGFTLVELLVVIAIIAALAGFATPLVLKQMKKADMATATHNAKQLHLALFDFDQDIGFFPESSDSEGLGSGGNNANDTLRQLFINGNISSEENFYAKTNFSKEPDGDIGTPPQYTEALEEGEVGFLYLGDQSSSVNSSRPLLAAPLIDTSQLKFDYETYGGKMVVLRIDGSVKQYKIDKEDSLAKIKVGGQDVDIFGTQNPVWGTGDNAVSAQSIALFPQKRGGGN